MAENPQCPTCGTELPADSPSGQCPKCLIGLGLTAGDAPPFAPDAVSRRKPRHFAGYELKRQIGCGGMGVVYEAFEIDLNRTVALKLILDIQACSPVARRRFLIEAEAAARLDHPNVVPIYRVGEHEDQPFISMKLVKGESLRAKMDRGEIRLPKGGNGATKTALISGQKAIARLIADVARAVHHAHAQNVVHRDLKPGNILIDTEGTPQLTDFGLAKILDGQHATITESGMTLGTPHYMSPEQVRSDRVSAATDTYSLGVILYELLTGRLPFKGTTPHETMRLIEEQSSTRLRTLNKHIHPDLETICLKCMEKDPGNRYSSTADLATDLDRWLRNQPIKARPTRLFLRTFRWIKRNPLGMSLILSLSLALVAVLGLLWQLKKRSDQEYANNKDRFTGMVNLLWADTNLTSLTLSVEELAGLERRSPPDTDGATLLTYALSIDENPIAQALEYAPFLDKLQNRMNRSLRPKVFFNLKFCKGYIRFKELASGEVDFQHFGAVSFCRAKELSPGVQAVLQDTAGKQAVIVVRSGSTITTLSQFADRTFAFPDTNATIGLEAKVELVKAGIRGTNLSFYQTVGDEEPLSERDAMSISDKNPDPRRGPAPGKASGLEAAYRVLKGSMFESEDFLDPTNFVGKLRSREDAVSQFLWSQLSTRTQQQALTSSNPASPKLLFALADDLNRILTNALYDPQRVAGIHLSAEMLALSSLNPQGDDLIRFNRLLLQDAYPRELARRRQIDGAALQEKYFDRIKHKGKGLKAIARFEAIPGLFAARAGLGTNIMAAFQRAILEMSNQKGSPRTVPWQGLKGEGFQKPDLDALERIRQALTNEAAQFEGWKPAPAPVPSRSPGPSPQP